MFQAVFDKFSHTDLRTRWTHNGLKVTVVTHTLLYLHRELLEIMPTVLLKEEMSNLFDVFL